MSLRIGFTRWFASGMLLAALSGSVRVSSAGENYAFLVAVADYDVKQLKPLQFTRNDILEFHQRLVDSGFVKDNIVLMHDDLKQIGKLRYAPTAENIRKEFTLLVESLREDDALIVAFAGHGVQFQGDVKNYFCPSDADLDDPKHERLVSLSELYDQLKACPAKRKLLLVDACRNDPQSSLSRSRQTVKLESVTRPQAEAVPEGILALFSCSAGQQSYEWPDLKHGVFFHHVLEAWQGAADDGDRKLSLDEVVAYTRQKTQTFARLNLRSSQTPQLKGDFSGTWVLREWSSPAKSLRNSLAMDLVLIPAGEFLMGSTAADVDQLTRLFSDFKKEYADDEQPQHRVRITRPFYLGKHEVTVGQFRQFVADTGYKTDGEKDPQGSYGVDGTTGKLAQKKEYTWRSPGFPQTDQHPVTLVSHNDAKAFCNWLSRKEGKTYRLPTEAEWEYACRAGTETIYLHGHDPEGLAKVGNVADGTAKAKFSSWLTIAAKDGYVFTAPIGSFSANAFGLQDMIGNVLEWCEDWYDATHYAPFAGRTAIDPTGPSTGKHRVLRGGSWGSHPWFARSANRDRDTPDIRNNVIGFRVVCE